MTFFVFGFLNCFFFSFVFSSNFKYFCHLKTNVRDLDPDNIISFPKKGFDFSSECIYIIFIRLYQEPKLLN